MGNQQSALNGARTTLTIFTETYFYFRFYFVHFLSIKSLLIEYVYFSLFINQRDYKLYYNNAWNGFVVYSLNECGCNLRKLRAVYS